MRDDRKRGAALLVVLFVLGTLVVLASVLALSTGGERRIATNELRAEQARYAAEAGARAVRGWFERPGLSIGFPADPSDVLRRRRDPAQPGAGVQYKQGVDLDGDGRDDLFRPPFDGGPRHRFVGTEAFPDVLVDRRETLDALSRRLLGDFPAAGAGVRARLERIAVFAPPTVRRGDGRVPRGTASIAVVAVVEQEHPGGPRVRLARRTARAVLWRAPYDASLLGPVHVCGDAVLDGPVGLRWGALAATGDVAMPRGFAVPRSLPRATPGRGGADRLWTEDPGWVRDFAAALAPGAPLRDPWVRVLAAGVLIGAPSAAPQPYAATPPPPPGTAPPWNCCDRSNLFQRQSGIDCPLDDYAFWKSVARSGLRGARYFRAEPDGRFREAGVDPPRRIDDLFAEAAGRPALWFFDTADGRAPRDDDGDGVFDNLTPPLRLDDRWFGRGVVFLHARRLELSDLDDRLEETVRPPGEPAVGRLEAWVDLDYPDTLDGPCLPGSAGSHEAIGPAIRVRAAFRGLLINAGEVTTGSGGTLVGTVVARGARLDGTSADPLRLVADATLGAGWPPSGWAVPRFLAGRWRID